MTPSGSRCSLLHTTGFFSAGGDLKAFAGDAPTIGKYAGLDRFPRLYKLIGGLGKPVICAANGDVLAGAFGLALACDLVIARKASASGARRSMWACSRS